MICKDGSPVVSLALFLATAAGCSSTDRSASATPDGLTAELEEALSLHASFDSGVDADFALGDGQP